VKIIVSTQKQGEQELGGCKLELKWVFRVPGLFGGVLEGMRRRGSLEPQSQAE